MIWRFMLPGKAMPCFPVFEDNQGTVQRAQNPVTNSNSKHIDVRHTFLRELVRQRDIKVVKVPSQFQPADTLSKALAYDLCCVSPKIPNEFGVFQRLGRAGIRRFRPQGWHQNNPFREQDYMIPCMVAKLAPNSIHFTRGLVK